MGWEKCFLKKFSERVMVGLSTFWTSFGGYKIIFHGREVFHMCLESFPEKSNFKLFSGQKFLDDQILKWILTWEKNEDFWKCWKTKILPTDVDLLNDSKVLSCDGKVLSQSYKRITWVNVNRLVHLGEVFEENWVRIVENLYENVRSSGWTCMIFKCD